MSKLIRMRSHLLWTIVAAGVLLSSLAGCGDTADAEGLFSAASGGAPSGGSGGTGGSSGTGGTMDASTGEGGSGGVGGSGGSGGSAGMGGTSAGGSGGTSSGGSGGTPTGGSGGTPTGGSGGTSVGGSGGTGPGGTGGATGGTGGTPTPDGEIPCPTYNPFEPQVCGIPGELCCVSFNNPFQGECVNPSGAPACETVINCAGPEDCPPGIQCCGSLVEYGTSNRYERVGCRPNCDGPADVLFCDPNDAYQTCPPGMSCEPSSILPDGYSVCRG